MVCEHHPTCHQFTAALKTVVINKLVTPSNVDKNCENDTCQPLDDLLSLMKFADDSSVSREEEDVQMAQHEQAISFNPSELSDLPEEDTQALAYVAGWVLKSIDVPDCEHCRSTLYSGEITNRHILTSFRERDDVQRLTYASDAVMSLVQNLHDYLNEFLTSSGFQRNLEDTFKISFKQHLDFAESHCTEHPCYDLILEKAIPFLIFKFCRDRQRQKTISDGHRTKMKRLS
ncbi:hypothetical protein TcasGA2_TC031703 [Tribolium castaneum]|uniref:Transposable element P transposase-like Protein n=1 Tax=Tribolium castaneum TaxID=7070 RepID=A0A139W9B5_TRICA|nr:hypothetical protein TcasGA2_TC031703 [Tribolium castaneum]